MAEPVFYGLKVLPPPEPHWEHKHGPPNIDVVAVHGLNGNVQRTWTHRNSKDDKTSGVHWLRDLLPYKVPRARVMAFGYQADVKGNTSSAGIHENARSLLSYLVGERETEQEAKRPIIWIGHSLGGIVIKQALKISIEDPRYASLSPESTTVMFFGTPHRGSSFANWGNLVASIGQYTLRLNDTFLKLLKANSTELAHISESFLSIASRFNIISFYEELSHPVVGKVVVPQHSAILQMPNEEVVMMTNSNHSSICKFQSLDDPRFSLVWKRILKISRLAAKPKSSISTVERDCLSLLFLKDVKDIRESVSALRYPGTNQWLAEMKDFALWKTTTQSSLLWVLGGPGYGKTVLTTTILDELEDLDQFHIPTSVLVYFFWDQKDDARNTAIAMYRTIIWQMLRQQPLLFKHILPEFQIQQQRLFDSMYSMWRIFTSMISDSNITTVVLVLDALDECDGESRQTFLWHLEKLLEKLSDSDSPNLKVVITSRVYDGICGALSDKPIITLTAEILQDDISHFVAGKVAEISRVRKYPPALAKRVETIVSEGANGMFLWASMILGQLKKTPIWAVEGKLKTLPQGIFEMYDSVLKAICHEAMETARYILQWIVIAMRPLSLPELAFALGTQYASINSLATAPFAYDIEGDIGLCGPIVTIRDGFVHLIHQSAKDFLLTPGDEALQYPSLATYNIEPTQAHREIAKTCIEYLTTSGFASIPLEINVRYGNETMIDHYLQDHPFLAYSAEHWLQHARYLEETNELLRLMDSFEWRTSEKFKAWFQIFWFSREMFLPVPMEITPCHVATHFQLSGYLEANVDETNVNILEPSYYGSLLHAAAWAGNLQATNILLELGGDVNIIGGRYGTALQAAASNGHEKIVERLLDHDAAVNLSVQCGAHGTALQAAAVKGYNGIVRLLLDHGAHVNLNRTEGCFGMALRAAADNGHQEIVSRLLMADTDIYAHAQGVDYGTALQNAAAIGDEQTVELLLAAGMKSFQLSGSKKSTKTEQQRLYDFGTALQAAVSTGQVETVELLIAAKADVNAQGSRNGNALTLAASSGHEILVDILIKAGAEVSKPSGGYGTPLIAACSHGHIRVVKQLLLEGASPNERGGFYGNPLRAAASNGHVMIVVELLDAGAKDSSDGVCFGTALEAAKENGHINVVSTLLEHSVREDDVDNCIANKDALVDLLAGEWRGYYYYAEGNRARDEGEVIFSLKDVSMQPNNDRLEVVPVEGFGVDKWGKFEILGTATIEGDILFQKNYAQWGWKYEGRLSAAERAMGGSWGLDTCSSYGTFAFYKVV